MAPEKLFGNQQCCYIEYSETCSERSCEGHIESAPLWNEGPQVKRACANGALLFRLVIPMATSNTKHKHGG